MRRLPRRTRSAACALLAALLLPVASGAPAAGGSGADPPPLARVADCPPLSSDPRVTPPRVVSRTGVILPDRTPDDTSAPGPVSVCVLVDSSGVVREANALGSGSPFDAVAIASARWWLFEPARRDGKPVPATLTVSIPIPDVADAEPLAPDVLAMALEAEAHGDVRGAIDAWTGVLARVGAHPSLGDAWSVRDRILDLSARLSPWPAVSYGLDGRARGARNLMQRNVSRAANADYARTLDQVLLIAPWFVEAYRWRAAACAASGRRFDAIRDVLCYQRAVPDSASRALAERALRALAAGDTLSANSLLKN